MILLFVGLAILLFGIVQAVSRGRFERLKNVLSADAASAARLRSRRPLLSERLGRFDVVLLGALVTAFALYLMVLR